MKVIGLQEAIECNHKLKESGLYYKIHIRDACGKQSLWIEPLSMCYCDDQTEEMYECIESYFKSKGYELAYSADRLNFWLN